jgi:hypothetical protein
MRKLFLVFACTLGGVLLMNAQGDFRAGAHLGIPIGDADEFTSLTIGVDASYLWTLDETFSVGVASGYGNYLGKDDFSNYSFIPLAASGRAGFSEDWFAGLDLGYAIGLEDGADGGFYYQPKVGWTNGMVDVFAYYQGISISDSDFTISSIGAGAAFKL